MIGIERGWISRDAGEGARALGLRTHALAALLGGVMGAIARGGTSGGLVLIGVAFAVFSAVAAVFRLREVRRLGTYGATTVVSAMMAFGLGALAVLGSTVAASAAAVATAGILASKPVLHAWVKRITWEELRAGLLLLAMTVVLLPILPNRELGPLDALNPHELWLMTVMIAVVSFAGYIAIRLAGEEKGILISGLAGGLTSSTAVTLSMARLATEKKQGERLFAAGVLLASIAMMVRVLIVAGIFNSGLALRLAPVLALAALGQAVVVWLLLRRDLSERAPDELLQLKNPFELRVVLGFGALLTAIVIVGKVAAHWGGGLGVLALAAFSGLADVDAITLSMARLARTELTPALAARAVLVAVGVNTITKACLAWMTGGAALGRLVLIGVATALAAGAAGLIALSVYEG